MLMNKTENELIEMAKQVFEIETESLNQVKDSLDDNFIKAVNLILNTSGLVS